MHQGLILIMLAKKTIDKIKGIDVVCRKYSGIKIYSL